MSKGILFAFVFSIEVQVNDKNRKGGRERVPGEEKRLVQAVEDIDNEIVIGNRVNIWTWELPIDEYPL